MSRCVSPACAAPCARSCTARHGPSPPSATSPSRLTAVRSSASSAPTGGQDDDPQVCRRPAQPHLGHGRGAGPRPLPQVPRLPAPLRLRDGPAVAAAHRPAGVGVLRTPPSDVQELVLSLVTRSAGPAGTDAADLLPRGGDGGHTHVRPALVPGLAGTCAGRLGPGPAHLFEVGTVLSRDGDEQRRVAVVCHGAVSEGRPVRRSRYATSCAVHRVAGAGRNVALVPGDDAGFLPRSAVTVQVGGRPVGNLGLVEVVARDGRLLVVAAAELMISALVGRRGILVPHQRPTRGHGLARRDPGRHARRARGRTVCRGSAGCPAQRRPAGDRCGRRGSSHPHGGRGHPVHHVPDRDVITMADGSACGGERRGGAGGRGV